MTSMMSSNLACISPLRIWTAVCSFLYFLTSLQIITMHNAGYWQLQMHPEHRKFLGISVIDPETNQPIHFEWNVMFLGISDAVFIFVSILSLVTLFHLQLSFVIFRLQFCVRFAPTWRFLECLC